MYNFFNDYGEGATQEILDELLRTNLEQTIGYGVDHHCIEAKALIKSQLNCDSAKVHLLVGGTQTNLTVIAATLRPHQGVVSATSGHINVHESGAIESTGHKVLTIPSTDGKICASEVEKIFASHYADDNFEHMVQPGMVYISNPTEIGTIYSLSELTALSAVCKKWSAPLFMDGARLGCALTALENDLTLSDITRLCDVFYIGGTKMGALFGEAVVINNAAIAKDFRYIIKQKGGLFAKGRLLGIQFKVLFTNNLYFKLATHANAMAKKLSDGFISLGFHMFATTMSNQVFPILPKILISKLRENFGIGFWESFDENCDVVRLCTSWATSETAIDELLKTLSDLKHKLFT